MGNGLEAENEYMVYMRGEKLKPAVSAEIILHVRAPYFNREGDHFCSHEYTPSSKGELYAAATQYGKVVVFSHPLLRQYRENVPRWCKRLFSNVVDLLLGNRLIRHDGPSTLSVNLLHQPKKTYDITSAFVYPGEKICSD